MGKYSLDNTRGNRYGLTQWLIILANDTRKKTTY